MTFTEIQTEVMDRLNLSSSSAQTRIGRAINRKYRLITSSIGMQLSRREVVQADATPGSSLIEFLDVEKVISVQDRSVSPYRTLDEVSLDELHRQLPYVDADAPTKWAAASHTSNTVTIEVNRVAQTDFTLYADAHLALFDLSGTNEPAFPESFHDIIIEGVIADELRKMEKPALAAIAKGEYERILSDLRMWIAKNNALDFYQGKTNTQNRSTSGGSSGSGTINGALSYTQTGLVTFDRSSAGVNDAPFAVAAGANKVANLDADLLDGIDSTGFAQIANGGVQIPTATVPAQTTDGVAVWDSNDDLLTVGTGAGRKTMVDTDSTQTLTSKTLTSPAINTPTITTGTLAGTTNVTGGQLAFPAAQSASANVNTLDDYEEGTWTPKWGGTTSESGQVYSNQTGRYIKIGKLVYINASISLTTLGTITGTLQIEDLPFTSGNVNAARATLVVGYFTGLSTNWIWLGGYLPNNSTSIQLTGRQSAGTGVQTLAQADLSNTTDFIFSMTYEASA